MHIRLEKFNHARRQKRYYALRVTPTLFGEYCLMREWGVIDGARQVQRDYLPAADLAVAELERLKTLKLKSGYAVIPVQIGLFT
ncbi:WGR domain-containing protein [Cognatishimia sp. SS12]|uniref:WGR domain-containing protein n=1 Tax=Cognatishimia sp. SS12 TaxID=2979465 RepID=UPI00232D758D|nr:WGR domain-containing protein [Cognatishimia sp. SS12]MDC0738823.1 WGR domain-containing protein [Cognatishimia sp. SS12]